MSTRTQAISRCPECGARVHVNAGSPTPSHQPDGAGPGAGECPGSGRPSR
ncbi:hypothetical protein [Dactylosporangium sp. CA-233914]